MLLATQDTLYFFKKKNGLQELNYRNKDSSPGPLFPPHTKMRVTEGS